MKKTALAGGTALIVLGAWLGIPAFNKWQADRLVDQMCANDGGITVYETVTLPNDRFNSRGQFEARDEKYLKPGDEYFSVWKVTNMRGRYESSDVGAVSISEDHFWIYRKADKKLLGEFISYSRIGGDPIGPWHPSSYSCRQQASLESQIFEPIAKGK